jgi:glycosyltransferase involved in cell wall biosynthesis
MLAYRLTDGLSNVTTAVCAAAGERYVRMKAVAEQKCVVLTNGIEVAEFVPDAGRRVAMREQMGVKDEFVWLAVGRMTAAKDFPNLMQAFGKVWSVSQMVQLWMAGGSGLGAGKPSYGAFCTPHGAMDHVRRLGVCHDMPALLDAADGFVLSSAWEGMPLALGEAMAMEKPVVATDVGGVRELVGDAGLIVPAKNSEALAEGMLSVIRRSEEEREVMGRAARERISRNFSMDAKADEWESMYRSVIR